MSAKSQNFMISENVSVSMVIRTHLHFRLTSDGILRGTQINTGIGDVYVRQWQNTDTGRIKKDARSRNIIWEQIRIVIMSCVYIYYRARFVLYLYNEE